MNISPAYISKLKMLYLAMMNIHKSRQLGVRDGPKSLLSQ